jgi:hypothetical protein
VMRETLASRDVFEIDIWNEEFGEGGDQHFRVVS